MRPSAVQVAFTFALARALSSSSARRRTPVLVAHEFQDDGARLALAGDTGSTPKTVAVVDSIYRQLDV